MKRFVIIILCFITFMSCLAVGIYISNTPSLLLNSQSTPTPFVTIEQDTSKMHQRNLVLVQVDDLKSSSPRLISVWLLLYFVEQPDISTILVYPQPNASPNNQAPELEKSFSLDGSGALSAPFIAVLKRYNFQYDGYMLMDNQGMARWIDWLHGVDLQDGKGMQTGAAVVQSMVLPWNGQVEARTWQEKTSQAICDKIIVLKTDSQWFPILFELMPDHFRTNLNLDMAVLDWKSLVSQEEPLSCSLMFP